MLGWFQEQTFVPDFWDKAEELPGCFMIQREIKKAISGQSFFFNDDETGKKVPIDGCKPEEFNFYYLLWDDYHWLKTLPHGEGTLTERRWVLEIIKMFEKTHTEVIRYIEERNDRKQEAELNRIRNKGK